MTRTWKSSWTLAALVVLAMAPFAKAEEKKDIVDTAVAAGSFKTLAAALQAADLVDALKGDGPFTVFAPTDEAFAKLPKGVVETLLKPENKEQLQAVLTYHVVAGKVEAKQVVSLNAAATVNGQRVDIAVKGDTVKVDNATVVATDIQCSNGVVHVIDSVILPSTENIVQTASKAGTFKTLLAAAKAAGLADALSSKGPLTVLAPTDDAFAKLPEGTVASLLKPENKAKLVAILKYHVVPGRIFSSDALKAKEAKTLNGAPVSFSSQGGKAKVNGANLVATDIDASNGVVHVIDSVILPPEKKKVSMHQGRKMIEHAVAQGARLYNAGHHDACAKIYMRTMSEMVDGAEGFPSDLMHNLHVVMKRAEHTSCPTQRSWTLRHGLDHAYATMSQTVR